eukprot:scaffold404544_cov34-Prasinocladus_malaysianus.AAC.1
MCNFCFAGPSTRSHGHGELRAFSHEELLNQLEEMQRQLAEAAEPLEHTVALLRPPSQVGEDFAKTVASR